MATSRTRAGSSASTGARCSASSRSTRIPNVPETASSHPLAASAGSPTAVIWLNVAAWLAGQAPREVAPVAGIMEAVPVNRLSFQLFAVLGASLCVSPRAVVAQEHAHDTAGQDAASSETKWTWTTDANAFVGYNYQKRRYADFASWDSQNWVMVEGGRRFGSGRVILSSTFSAEPWTVGRLVYSGDYRLPPTGGTPQLYQTGESYNQIPLVNYQHPHDLVMGLGVTYRFQAHE